MMGLRDVETTTVGLVAPGIREGSGLGINESGIEDCVGENVGASDGRNDGLNTGLSDNGPILVLEDGIDDNSEVGL